MKKGLIIFILLLLPLFVYSQTTVNKDVVTVQPKIMVVPYTKEGEDIRSILEEDVNRRIAITKIKEAFDSRGFTTVDFTAKLKAATDNAIFSSENKEDLKTRIIQMSGADV